ncbi:MAG: hypothetical protein LBD25_08430 [Coriobacteriales bacterium]|jgi:hypothetical protein|nr:hypothetical protein [Coriobacteriales bacterium]
MLKYDLHDSLIESVVFNAESKSLEIAIELCNWRQPDYQSGDPEMLCMRIIFEGVEKYELSIDDFEFDSNEILEVTYDDDRPTVLAFLTEQDAETIRIKAKSVWYSFA